MEEMNGETLGFSEPFSTGEENKSSHIVSDHHYIVPKKKEYVALPPSDPKPKPSQYDKENNDVLSSGIEVDPADISGFFKDL